MKNLNQLGKLALVAMMATTAIPAHAVWYGNEVPQEESADFRVFVAGAAGNCGGQIIAGKYVITAMHCVSKNTSGIRQLILDNNGITDMPDRIDDVSLLEASITRSEYSSDIYFGSNTQKGGQRIEVTGSIINPEYVWRWRYGLHADKKQYIADNFSLEYDFSTQGDLVILKLSEEVLQQSASILDTGTIIDPAGKVATLSGWGLNENGITERTLKEISLEVSALPYNLGDTAGLKTYGENVNPLANSSFDYPILNRVDDGNGYMQRIDSGDSGSPVILEGFTLGFVSAMAPDSGTGITGPAYWIKSNPWIARNIDEVNTVGKVVLTIDADFTDHEWIIPVQSLKIDDVEVNSTTNLLSRDDNGFTVNSDCNPTLSTGDYCHITLTYNGHDDNDSLILQEGQVAENLLIINDSLQIPIAVIYPSKPVVLPTPTPTQPNDEKSGGSFSVFASLLLSIEIFRRRLK
ncbi:MAG: trypsin-like serine protease [Moritella sp.]|uniref:trypsin-like serine protease n=1 Tax=Moritella sp. TaxID=78556 RepID=UPI001E12545E|nr:trypsin-like serine protease [Moritella sp.]NQZ49371.1 trypsin-like serine protease [Moritella sp.]